MFEREDKELLKEIIESFDKVFEVTENISYEDFRNSSEKIHAVLSEIDSIGNKCKYVTGEFRLTNEEINWNYLIKTRKRLSHSVLAPVNTDVMWALIKEDYPPIKNNILKLL